MDLSGSEDDFVLAAAATKKKTAAAKVPKVPKAPRATKATKPLQPAVLNDVLDGDSKPVVAKKPRAPKKTTKAASSDLSPPTSKSDNDDNDDNDDSDDYNYDEIKPTKRSAQTNKSIEEIYQKKTQLEHILLRPDTYIGSVESIDMELWLYEDNHMVFRKAKIVPGLYKIFDEIIVNACDNKSRDSSMTELRVNIDRENSSISVLNNGKGIPVEIHAKEGVYVPELIFGHLLTSSNYDDAEKKVTGGRNGYGAKLCNIFSSEFVVETADSSTKRRFKQVFTDNMSKRSEPVVTPLKSGHDFTKITFRPDLSKFGMDGFDDDFVALLTKRVYDAAGVVRGINVFLNDVKLPIKTFKDYIKLYIPPDAPLEEGEAAPQKYPVIYDKPSERWEVAFTVSDGQFQQVSFVNSICTMKGGTHVAHVSDQLVNAISEAIKKKAKKSGSVVKPAQIRNHMSLFINCAIENPSFDSQTKENMTLKPTAFGSKYSSTDKFIRDVLSSGVVESIMSYSEFKQQQSLKKTDGKKTGRLSSIPKLEDANWAGGRYANQCTLILTEGDSAKTLAVSGLSVVGRDKFGVFPLRGKLLNVRDATTAQIIANAEIQNIKKIMGLQTGKVYENTDSLRYGHVMIMTDQDHDGSHIKGLLINFFDHFWPSLLKIPGFLLEFITPIIKASKGKAPNRSVISFFTIPEYEAWKGVNNGGKGWTIKYYKGLGTSSGPEAKEYFSRMDLHVKPFATMEGEDRSLVELAFGKKNADNRKTWLGNFQPGTYMDNSVEEVTLSDFVNKELILFSMADNIRSIPSLVDGFKPGQRKIIFACFKRNLRKEIKVAQLSGYVAEHSAYHHGEQSLSSTIVNLAQNFVGSNNIALLEPHGQFGTRLTGGKDAASARYIHTNLSPITRALFPEDDDPLLNYLDDDGQSIEPEWYVPICPMVLVNGSEGIGTGWSTSIPNYNPRDIVENIRRMMRDEPTQPMMPWYRGFKGTIVEAARDRYQVSGIIEKIDDQTIRISELPLKKWVQDYKEQLELWRTGVPEKNIPQMILDFYEYHTDSIVHFVIELTPQQMAAAEEEGLEKRFKLSTTLSTSNLVCFNQHGRIQKFENVDQILKEFYGLRLEYYQKRKAHLLSAYQSDLLIAENKVRFIVEINDGKLVVQKRKRVDIVADLRKRGYAEIFPNSKGKKTEAPAEGDDAANEDEAEREAEDEAESNGSGTKGYSYLLSMPIHNLTAEKVKALQEEERRIQDLIKDLLSKSPKDLWQADLDRFIVKLDVSTRCRCALSNRHSTYPGPWCCLARRQYMLA
ncbi:DNA topoisomerase [Polychytrium aggregatum]|uniref:DNA topoisomerase n=1 Tax=Polychytrium aggregatum TaxID=110093 RepID=UPI0022FF17BF|nr:DNA topoisomerase [Polychytrium aggregatum]KAI9193271.1 DNA topoisomerase [Polychytrium aggregatum]